MKLKKPIKIIYTYKSCFHCKYALPGDSSDGVTYCCKRDLDIKMTFEEWHYQHCNYFKSL